jgi:hypothetical protein
VARLSVFTWIGNAAARFLGSHGAVTEQAAKADCSRQTVYDHADKVQHAVADAQLHGPSRQHLLLEVQQLRDENRQLWDWLDTVLDCPKDQQRQFAVTAAAMGLSLQQTLTLLAILLCADRLPSRATLGRWVQQGARRAGRLLNILDAACQRLVLCLCLDEIFFHRRPVLMAIEPHSMAWVVGERVSDRSGPTWAKALAAWPAVKDVAADGGSGIELGLKLAAAKRREQGAKAKVETAAVPLHVRLDVFHIKRDGERVLRLEWAAAERLWEEAEKVSRAKGRYDRTGVDRRHFKKDVAEKAWAPAEAALEAAEGVEAAWRRASAALEVWRPDGRLNERAWAAAELRAAAAGLPGARWAKVRRMLLDERALTFLDRLHEELARAESCAERREALVALWRWRRSSRQAGRAACSATAAVRGLCCSVLEQRLGPGWPESYGRVSEVLSGVVRASSAVECVNSVIRMHQGRHRNLSQDLVDLKRLYWNCRAFVSGKRRKHCPYEHLKLQLPTYDPWKLLQMDPEELMQQLSSSGVAK